VLRRFQADCSAAESINGSLASSWDDFVRIQRASSLSPARVIWWLLLYADCSNLWLASPDCSNNKNGRERLLSSPVFQTCSVDTNVHMLQRRPMCAYCCCDQRGTSTCVPKQTNRDIDFDSTLATAAACRNSPRGSPRSCYWVQIAG